jgi:hypothetical protein
MKLGWRGRRTARCASVGDAVPELGKGADLVRAHHFVVFMLEDVAMPDVAAGVAVETDDDAGDHAGFGAHCVLPPCFRRIGRDRVARELQLVFADVGEGLKTAAVEDLKFDEMQMDGMRIVGGIDQIPDFDRIKERIFGDGHVPGRVVKEHFDWVLHQVVNFIERKHARFYRG